MCIDDDELEYLFVRVDETELIHLITTGCGLRAIFTKAGKKIRRVVLTQSLNDEFIAKSKITDDMLPGKNVRYDFSNKDNEGYLGRLKSITLIKVSTVKCVVVQASNKSVAACHPIKISKKISTNANEKKALFVKGICGKRVNLVKDNSKSSRKLKGKKNFS